MKLFKSYEGKWVLLVRPQHLKYFRPLRWMGFWFSSARIGQDINWSKLER